MGDFLVFVFKDQGNSKRPTEHCHTVFQTEVQFGPCSPFGETNTFLSIQSVSTHIFRLLTACD